MECTHGAHTKERCEKCEHEQAKQSSALNDGLCDLKSQIAKNRINDIIGMFELKLKYHKDGSWTLCQEALEDYQHDINLLKKLGA